MNATVLIEKTMAETIVADPPAVPDVGIDERVLAGAALLDEAVPGWANRINLAWFDLSNGDRCVLGQVYGDAWADDDDWFGGTGYGRGCYRLGLKFAVEKQEVGFLWRDDPDPDGDEDRDLDRLEQDWRLVIAERQGAAA